MGIANKAYADNDTNCVFDTKQLVSVDLELLKEKLVKYKVSEKFGVEI